MKNRIAKKILGLLIATAMVLFGGVEQAEALVIVDGTDISNAVSGVTLSTVGNYDGADGNVYALTDSLASTGTKVFGNSWTITANGCRFDTSSQPHLRVDFDSLAMWVMIDAIGNNSEDYGRPEAYSSTSTLSDVYETGLLLLQNGDVDTMSISCISEDIAYILVAGKDQGSAPRHTIHLGNLNYVVPKSGTLCLLGLGGLVLRKRK